MRVSWQQRSVLVRLPRAAVEDAPEFDPSAALTADFEARLHEHYDKPVYGQGQWVAS